MSTRRLLQIQAISGSAFLLFTLVHLANTGVASLGIPAYDGFMRVARLAYQNPLVEIVALFIPLTVHWAAAIIRLQRDGFRRKNQTLRSRLHRYSGYFLLTFIWGHVAATRGRSLLADIEVSFTAISFTFAWLPFGVTADILLIGLAGLSGDLYPIPNPLDSEFARLAESILGEMSPYLWPDGASSSC